MKTATKLGLSAALAMALTSSIALAQNDESQEQMMQGNGMMMGEGNMSGMMGMMQQMAPMMEACTEMMQAMTDHMGQHDHSTDKG